MGEIFNFWWNCEVGAGGEVIWNRLPFISWACKQLFCFLMHFLFLQQQSSLSSLQFLDLLILCAEDRFLNISGFQNTLLQYIFQYFGNILLPILFCVCFKTFPSKFYWFQENEFRFWERGELQERLWRTVDIWMTRVTLASWLHRLDPFLFCAPSPILAPKSSFPIL